VTLCPITSDCVDAPLFRVPLPPCSPLPPRPVLPNPGPSTAPVSCWSCRRFPSCSGAGECSCRWTGTVNGGTIDWSRSSGSWEEVSGAMQRTQAWYRASD